MIYNEAITQFLSPQDLLPPQAIVNMTVNTSGIDMSHFQRIRYLIQTGAVGAGGTLAVTPQSSATPNFTVAHNVSNCTLTPIAAANSASQCEIRADQITYQNPGDRYVRLALTGSGASVTASVTGDGACSPQGPAAQYNINTVIQQTVLCST